MYCIDLWYSVQNSNEFSSFIFNLQIYFIKQVANYKSFTSIKFASLLVKLIQLKFKKIDTFPLELDKLISIF